MRRNEAAERIGKLRETINRHRYLYHVLDTQEISDAALDSLKHELAELEEAFPDLVTSDSPTQRVSGKPLEKFRKVEHSVPMLSVQDVFEETEARDWEAYLKRLAGEDKIGYFAEAKIDGLAVSLIYEKGRLAVAATRGDGRVGEDVTQNVRTLESVPLSLQIHEKLPRSIEDGLRDALGKGTLEVRGEVYMDVKDFEAFNKERAERGEAEYANPRNLAAGSVRQLDPDLTARRPLKFLGYEVVGEFGQTTHGQEHDMLRSLGFATDGVGRVLKTVDEVLSFWRGLEQKRDKLPFQIDGAAVSVNDNRLFERLGVAGKGYRGMRAFKFAGKQATTRVLDIKVQVGRTGAATPVASLEPVKVGGVTVSRATLHNPDEVERLGVRVGDTVVVERAGDVIPRVVEVLKELRTGKERPFAMPSACPVCGRPLKKPKGEVVWRCQNKNCRARKAEFLENFVSRKGLDIAGLGPKILAQLAREGLVSEPSDLFELSEGDLSSLERFAETSAANLVAAVRAGRRPPLDRFVYALGIRHVGEETARDLAERFGNLARLRKAPLEELEGVRDVGSVVARAVFEWFSDEGNAAMVDKLLEAGVKPRAAKRPSGGKLRGRTVVFTGRLETMSREEAEQKVRELGGEAAGSVSAKTAYVVAGQSPGTKADKAKQLGVPVLSEREFLRRTA